MINLNNQRKRSLFSIICNSTLIIIFLVQYSQSRNALIALLIAVSAVDVASFYIWPDYRFKTEVIRRLLSPWLWVPVLLVLVVATVDMIWPRIGNILQYIPIIPIFIVFVLYKFGYIDQWKMKLFGNKVK